MRPSEKVQAADDEGDEYTKFTTGEHARNWIVEGARRRDGDPYDPTAHAKHRPSYTWVGNARKRQP